MKRPKLADAATAFVPLVRLAAVMLACACSSSERTARVIPGPPAAASIPADSGVGLTLFSRMPWSPDGRYVVIDLAVVDVDISAARPSGCRRDVVWGSSTRFACGVGDDHEETMEVDDLASARQRRFEHCALGNWSSNGRYFACLRGDFVFDVDTFAVIPLPSMVSFPSFVGNGPFVRLDTARGGPSGKVQLWSLESRTAVDEPYGDTTEVRWTSPNGRFELWIAGSHAYLTDAVAGTHRLLADDANINMRDGSQPFAPDGSEVAVPISNGGVGRFNVRTGAKIATLAASGCEDATEIAFSPKGDVIALGTSASVVCTFDRATNELLHSWTAPKPADPAVDVPVGILEFAGGGDGLVVGHLDFPGWSGAAALYRASGELLADLGKTLTADIRHDPSGALMLSCARVSRDLEVRRSDPDGPLRVHEGATCIEARVESLPLPSLHGLDGAELDSLDPTSTRVLGTVDGRATIWSLKTGAVVFSR